MAIRPVIYQLLPRLFTNLNPDCVPNGSIIRNGSGKMNDINNHVLKSIKELGVTHVWYTGVIEHAHTSDYTRFGISRDNPYVVKGKAGSPYAIKDYYDIDPDIAENVPERVKEFEKLVIRTHAAGMGVIMDFVPNHVARQYHSDSAPRGIRDFGDGDDNTKFFDPNNNFYYMTRQQFAPSIPLGHGADAYVEFPARATGNDCYTAFPSRNDWYETVKLNYGVDPWNGSRHFSPIPDTWLKMLHILRYWAAKGVDGFRCDMAHMVPVEFWSWAISNIKESYPDVKFIAEIYDMGLYREFIYRAGFDYLYDKVNLYDTLRGVMCSQLSAAAITNCWQGVEGIAPHMLNFLENHDEQRFASPQYAGDAMKVLPSLVVMSMLSTGPLMIYMGQEIGEPGTDAEGFSGNDGRTTIFDYWSIETLRRWLTGLESGKSLLTGNEEHLRDIYSRVLTLVNSNGALRDGAFFDLMYVNYDNPTLNPHRQYTFMRSCAESTLVIAVNFDSEPASLKVNIPPHAFETLGLRAGTSRATELLTGLKEMKTLAPTEPFAVDLDAYGAAVWEIRNDKLQGNVKKSLSDQSVSHKK